MKINDLTIKQPVNELTAGNIINFKGKLMMVTNSENCDDNYTELVYMDSGVLDEYTKISLLNMINDPDENVRLVSESELLINGYH